jgi:hypothetical protein
MNCRTHRTVANAVLLGGLLALAAPAAFAQNARVTLGWNPSSGNIAGYRLYHGTSPGNYTALTDVGLAVQATVSNLTYGVTYYFAMTSYDIIGLESPFSNEINYTPQTTPPGITLSSPLAGNYTPPATLNFAANVIPNGHTISKVQFYLSSALVREVTTAPYTFTLNNVAAGNYYAMARVVYDGGSVAETANGTFVNVAAPHYVPGVTIAADSGSISLPFVTLNGSILQSILSTLLGGGRAVYNFNITKPGDYIVSGLVNAPSSSENSFYLNIDAEPTDPLMLWNLVVSSGFTNQAVSWGGVSDTVPHVFNLSAGAHQLIVRGREPNAQLGTITIIPAPLQATALPNKQVAISGVGQAGHTYDVQASQNLSTWSTIGSTIVSANGTFQFTDTAAPSFRSRSYRLLFH